MKNSGAALWYHVGCPCVHLSIRLLYVSPSYLPLSVFWFPDDNLSKCQWIFTKLDAGIDFVEIWFGIVNGQISSIFNNYLPTTDLYFHFRMITLLKFQWIFIQLGMCIDIVEIWFGIADGQISSIFDSYLPGTCPYFHF